LEENVLLLGFIEIINITLAGWFFFTYFFPSNAIGLVTEPDVNSDPKLMIRMQIAFCFIGTSQLALQALRSWINEEDYFIIERVPITYAFYVFIISGFFALVFGFLTYRNHRYQGSKESRDISEILDSNLEASKPLQKLRRNLDDNKLAELSRLLFESRMLQERSSKDIARFIWLSLIWVMVLETLVELANRMLG